LRSKKIIAFSKSRSF